MYRILYDYGSEGMKFHDDEYNTVDEAVKGALAHNYCTKFLIVTVVEWHAKAI